MGLRAAEFWVFRGQGFRVSAKGFGVKSFRKMWFGLRLAGFSVIRGLNKVLEVPGSTLRFWCCWALGFVYCFFRFRVCWSREYTRITRGMRGCMSKAQLETMHFFIVHVDNTSCKSLPGTTVVK